MCVGGEVIFIPFIFIMAGHWSPRRAREEVEEHERYVAEQLNALAGPGPDPGTATPAEA